MGTADVRPAIKPAGIVLPDCLHHHGQLYCRKTCAAQSHAPRNGPGHDRIRFEHSPGAIHYHTYKPGPCLVSHRPGGHRFAVRVAWRGALPEEAASRGSAPGIEVRIEIKTGGPSYAKNHAFPLVRRPG